MNKKIFAFVMFGILTFGLGSAAIISHFGLFSTNLNVTQPIQVSGNENQEVDCFAGQSCNGDLIEVDNSADFSIDVSVSSTYEPGIKTSYVSNLELTKKDVDFTQDVWTVLGEKVQVRYTLIGDSFFAEVTEGELEGYGLFYYKDNSDRFNDPSKVISVSEVIGNLPYESDGNIEEYNYCDTGEYLTCNGAKIWYVPLAAVDSEGELDWSRASEFYFESKLIQYNAEGHIIIYDGLDFTPVYHLSSALETGNYTIDTTVTP